MVKVAATLALLSVALMCGAVGYSVVTVNKHLSSTLMKLDSEIDEAHRLTLEAGLTVMEARKASLKESAYLDQWNKQLSKTLTDVDLTVSDLRTVSAASVGMLNTTQQTVNSLQAPIQSANQTLMAAQKAISDLDKLEQDPALTDTIAHTDATMSHLDATTKDVQDEVYRYTHPGIWTKIKGFALDIAKVFNPL